VTEMLVMDRNADERKTRRSNGEDEEVRSALCLLLGPGPGGFGLARPAAGLLCLSRWLLARVGALAKQNERIAIARSAGLLVCCGLAVLLLLLVHE
jgi:hypothetical protein